MANINELVFESFEQLEEGPIWDNIKKGTAVVGKNIKKGATILGKDIKHEFKKDINNIKHISNKMGNRVNRYAQKSSNYMNNYPKSKKILSTGLKYGVMSSHLVPAVTGYPIPGLTAATITARKFVDSEGTNKDVRKMNILFKKVKNAVRRYPIKAFDHEINVRTQK